MARGRPDWWYGMTPAKTLFGIGQSSFLISETADIAAASYADLCEYAVPSGFILNVGYTAVSCNGPGVMDSKIYLAGAPIAESYWDMLATSALPDTSLYQVPTGLAVALRVYNLDTVTWTFTATFIGYEEVREP